MHYRASDHLKTGSRPAKPPPPQTAGRRKHPRSGLLSWMRWTGRRLPITAVVRMPLPLPSLLLRVLASQQQLRRVPASLPTRPRKWRQHRCLWRETPAAQHVPVAKVLGPRPRRFRRSRPSRWLIQNATMARKVDLPSMCRLLPLLAPTLTC